MISQSGNELTLNKNYKFNSSTDKDYDGFTISKDNYVVDGQGYTIDGSGQASIFIFTGSNITLKNVNIINAKGTNGPAACFASLGIVDNCSFINNSASGLGGAIYINASVSNCKINSTFINNSAYRGGAIFFNNETDNFIIDGYFEGNEAERIGGAIVFQAKSSNNIISADFYNNRAKAASGGAIFFRNLAENNQFEGIFTANYAVNGGAIFFYNKANNNRFDCDFSFNVGNSSGGAIVFFGATDGNNFTGCFVNNSALGGGSGDAIGNGGAITFSDVSSNCLFACDFINNTAAVHGGAVNYRQTPYNITFNGNFINDNAKYGGGVNFFENIYNVIFNGKFTGNSTIYGVALGTNLVSVKDNATLISINVDPAQLRNINISNTVYGETVRISSDVVDENNVPFKNGTLYVLINENEYSADVTNGTATVEISNLNAGNYNVDLKYLGNQRVVISSVTFNVSKQDAVISAKNNAYTINYGGKYSITLKDSNGKVVAGEKVTFKLNGKVIGSATTNAKGIATISLTAKTLKSAKVGKKNMVITLTSDNYNAAAKTVKITINKEKTKIVAKNKMFKKSQKTKKYTIVLKNSKGKAVKKVKVTLKVKGKTYAAKTNAKGKATFKITKLTKKGNHKATIKYKGNKYYKASSKKIKITIK